MTRPLSLEPGLLPIFRLFAGLHLGIVLIGFLTREPGNKLFHLIVIGMLTVYLWWPGLPQRLGSLFLPLGLLVAAIDPIFSNHLELLEEFEAAAEPNLIPDFAVLTLTLLIPLILVGWQYNFRTVLAYCAGTAALDVGLTSYLSIRTILTRAPSLLLS